MRYKNCRMFGRMLEDYVSAAKPFQGFCLDYLALLVILLGIFYFVVSPQQGTIDFAATIMAFCYLRMYVQELRKISWESGRQLTLALFLFCFNYHFSFAFYMQTDKISSLTLKQLLNFVLLLLFIENKWQMMECARFYPFCIYIHIVICPIGQIEL